MITIPAGYYAAPDPDQPEQAMTYWHIRPGARGAMNWTAWPPKARYGPKLLRRDVPADHHAGLVVKRAFGDRLLAWNERVRSVVEADPVACVVRFADLQSRCFCCARALTSARWKLLGVGPDCCRQHGLNPAVLALLTTPAIATAHAIHAAQKAQAAA